MGRPRPMPADPMQHPAQAGHAWSFYSIPSRLSSQIGEDSHRKVTVIVENGLAVSIDGNGFHSPALVSIDSLEMIEQALVEENMGSEEPSTITISNQEVE